MGWKGCNYPQNTLDIMVDIHPALPPINLHNWQQLELVITCLACYMKLFLQDRSSAKFWGQNIKWSESQQTQNKTLTFFLHMGGILIFFELDTSFDLGKITLNQLPLKIHIFKKQEKKLIWSDQMIIYNQLVRSGHLISEKSSKKNCKVNLCLYQLTY